MVELNVAYGATCAVAFAAAALLSGRLWHPGPLGTFGKKLVAGLSVGVGLAATLG